MLNILCNSIDISVCLNIHYVSDNMSGGQGVAVVTDSPATSEVGSFNPKPDVENMVVSYRWLAIYSTEPWPTVCSGFLCP